MNMTFDTIIGQYKDLEAYDALSFPISYGGVRFSRETSSSEIAMD